MIMMMVAVEVMMAWLRSKNVLVMVVMMVVVMLIMWEVDCGPG